MLTSQLPRLEVDSYNIDSDCYSDRKLYSLGGSQCNIKCVLISGNAT